MCLLACSLACLYLYLFIYLFRKRLLRRAHVDSIRGGHLLPRRQFPPRGVQVVNRWRWTCITLQTTPRDGRGRTWTDNGWAHSLTMIGGAEGRVRERARESERPVKRDRTHARGRVCAASLGQAIYNNIQMTMMNDDDNGDDDGIREASMCMPLRFTGLIVDHRSHGEGGGGTLAFLAYTHTHTHTHTLTPDFVRRDRTIPKRRRPLHVLFLIIFSFKIIRCSLTHRRAVMSGGGCGETESERV